MEVEIVQFAGGAEEDLGEIFGKKSVLHLWLEISMALPLAAAIRAFRASILARVSCLSSSPDMGPRMALDTTGIVI